jgi:hypothetical protein
LDSVKITALVGMGLLGAFEAVNPSSGLECRSNKFCTPGLPIMGDEPSSELPEPLVANMAVASGGMPTITVTPAPGWTVERTGYPVTRLLISLPEAELS